MKSTTLRTVWILHGSAEVETGASRGFVTCRGQWQELSEEHWPSGDGGKDVLRTHRELTRSVWCAHSRWFKMLKTVTGLL